MTVLRRARLRPALATALALPTAVLVGVTGLPAASAATGAGTAASAGTDTTSSVEAQRVDRVKLSLSWFDCTPLVIDGKTPADCSTATLPLDYDKPKGATTQVAVMRLKARNAAARIGTLFLNPGGPGGSGVAIAAQAPMFLSKDLLDRFDVVGFDPRGTNLSDNVRCWADLGQQAKALKPLDATGIPTTQAQITDYVAAAKAFGKACSTTGKPLSGAMSTAEVARDMDVLRRTLGDSKLSYLGFSYGTYLGATYASMFPDRVRAVVLDGNLDPVGWAGTSATRNTPQTARIRSGEGADKALRELLTRCGKAGQGYCDFAGFGDPTANYAKLTAELKAITGTPKAETVGLDYPSLVGFLLGDLYSPEAGAVVDGELTVAWTLLHGDASQVSAAKARVQARRAAARQVLKAADSTREKLQGLRRSAGLAVEWPYNNRPEAFQSVLCTDGLNPADAGSWAKVAAAQEITAPGFGPLWTWASAPCASNTWTAQDADAYRGPFTRRTANPVLVVGAYWDPATNYDSSVALSKLLPNSRLLSNDNWGHTSYSTSSCDTEATDAYLLTLALPAAGTVCTGDTQPYTTPYPTMAARSGTDLPAVPETGDPKLPPVSPMIPGIAPMR